MLTKSKEKHIEWIMTHPDDKVTISGLSIGSGTAYPQTYNNVQDLVQQKILATEDVPPAKLVTIHYLAPKSILLSVEANRKEEFLKKHSWIRLMLNDLLDYTNDFFFILTIFGGYAKGIETKHSDLDLLLIVPSKDKIPLFERAVKNIYTKIKKEVIIVTTQEFINMIKKSSEFNVGNEAKKHHILLYGAEQWYSIIEKVK